MKISENKTIRDFGCQWTKFTENKGFYASKKLFDDIVFPLIDSRTLVGKDVAEIGSGTGRIVKMLIESGVKHIYAVEPSDGYKTLIENLSGMELNSQTVECINVTGDKFSPANALDAIFSIGVLHHIEKPSLVVKKAFEVLTPGGFFFIWVYAKEGNYLYLSVVEPLRMITKHMSHSQLQTMVSVLYSILTLYERVCRVFRLPMSSYLKKIFFNLAPDDRRLVIYDQLNPFYAKYYKKMEVLTLLERGGFKDIKIHHRHGYSWSAVGYKPL